MNISTHRVIKEFKQFLASRKSAQGSSCSQTAQPTETKQADPAHPVSRLIFTIGVSVWISEIAIMWALGLIHSLPGWAEVLIDGLLLCLIIVPVSYLLFLKPQAKTERERAKACERLKHLLFSNPTVIYSCKADGDFGATFISENVKAQLGYQPEDFLTDSSFWASHIHPDDSSRVLSGLSDLFEKGDHVHEYRFQVADGSYRWMRDKLALIRDSLGKPMEIVGSWIDITTRKEMERSLKESGERLRLATTSANIGIWHWNILTDELAWSDQCKELHGLTADQTISYNIFLERLHPDDRVKADNAIRDALENNTEYDTEYRVVWPDESISWLVAKGLAHYDSAGKPASMQGVVLDITDRKSYENELIKARQVAEDLTRQKDQFLSTMSHELRTPLNGIIGSADLLYEKLLGPLSDKQLQYVAQINSSANHLLSLINDLLDLAKIDSGGRIVCLENVFCGESIDALNAILSSQIKKKGLHFKITEDFNDVCVQADQRALKQILLNLISNAIKYTPEGGHITISGQPTEDGFFRIEVNDTGIGIEPEVIDRVFDEFYQVNRVRDEQLGGTGIGLGLTRRLVKMHGGDIGVESEVGQGSSFWFTLRSSIELSSEYESLAVSEEHLQDRAASGKILLVEDNEVNREVILDMLLVRGYEVETACNGQEGLEKAATFSPDLILMDIRMPIMDGITALERLRQMPGTDEIPVIALTADASDKSIKKHMLAGFQDHLSKPIRTAALYAVLDQHVPTATSELKPINHEIHLRKMMAAKSEVAVNEVS